MRGEPLLNEKPVEVSIEKRKHPRTNHQNRYYWDVVVKEIAQHTGHDPEQTHELSKQIFPPRWHFARMGGTEHSTPTSTTRLDTLAFVEYREKCRMWANEFLGLQISLPGEVTV